MSFMEQKHLAKFLPAYLDGTLDDVSQQKIKIELEHSPAAQKLLADLQADEKRWQYDHANLESVSTIVPPRLVIQQMLQAQQIQAQQGTTRLLALGGLSAMVLLAVVMLGSVILLASASIPVTVAPTSSAGGGGFVTQNVPPPTATPQEGIVNYLTFPPNPTLPSEIGGKILKKEEIKLIWPVRGEITKRFGDAVYNGSYAGLYILVGQGIPIIAAMEGVVAASGWERGFGYSVRIRHAVNFETLYAHLLQPSTLTVGQVVQRAHIIGYVGSSGDSIEPHLHFQTQLDGKAVDPLQFLP
jgi:hypothetical protein